MDVLFLSRLQFAAAAFFHFLFVPLTLGLSVLVAFMETRYVLTRDEEYRSMARFWGKLFIINFGIGIVTGLTLEFQFGTNWSRYSIYVGDIFGSLLAIEATLAFFLESTFLAIWIFGWKRLSPRLHALCIWLVALAANVSAYWILTANAWMQHPVGYHIVNGRAELTDFLAVVTQRAAVVMFLHTVSGAFILSGFFMMGVSAYHLLKKRHEVFFQKSFRIAVWFTLIFSLFEVVQGHLNGADVARNQPAKLAAMEALWETQTRAPQTLFLIPDEKNERNLVEIGKVPGVLSLLAYHRADAEVKGLRDFPPEDRPPVLLSFLSFRIMIGLGMLFPLLAGFGWLVRRRPAEYPRFLRILILAIPLPYIAIEMGWMLTEVGRQPWIVYGVMRTRDAVSPIAASQVAVSLGAFVIVYSLLGLADFYLLAKFARRGPESEQFAPFAPLPPSR
jgi:cytochrome d ubiquinol oxidase subunit I